MSVQGLVEVVDERAGEAEVSVGNVRLRVGLGRVTHADASRSLKASPRPAWGWTSGPVLGTMEIDLRGMQADDASIRTDEFLDRAVRDGLRSVRIIHGKGTGVLRRVIRELLERHPLVKSFGSETPLNGGSGATSVELA